MADSKWNFYFRERFNPDYLVEITQKDLDAKKDPQMNKAVELLLQ